MLVKKEKGGIQNTGQVAKLVEALVLGTSGAIRGGSTPPLPTLFFK